jgi:hypothetical protein
MTGYAIEYGPQYEVEIILIPDQTANKVHMEGKLEIPRDSPLAIKQQQQQPLPQVQEQKAETHTEQQLSQPSVEQEKESDKSAESKSKADADNEKMNIYLKHVKESGSQQAKTIAYREGDMLMQLPLALPQPVQPVGSNKRR